MIKTDELRERIEWLQGRIKTAAQAYYQGASDVSDDVFDRWVVQLRELAPTDPLLTSPGYGFLPEVSPLAKASHSYGVVGGLDTITTKEGIERWLDTRWKVLYMLPKYDGISVVLYLDRGNISLALTRGDGQTGLDITPKIHKMIGTSIPLLNRSGAVRGEIHLPISVWEEKYSDKPSPRNVAAGIINRKKREEWEPHINDLELVLYKFHGLAPGDGFSDMGKMLYALKETGLGSVYTYITPDTDRLSTITDLYPRVRGVVSDTLTDGVVIYSQGFSMSTSGWCEYDHVALKLHRELKEAVIQSVVWNVTRTGKVVPVALLKEPVIVSGASLRRFSAFNASWVRSRRLGEGAEVIVTRAGDVIPYLEEVTLPSSKLNIPTHCPSCQGELIGEKDSHLVCDNARCPARDMGKLVKFLRTLAPIEGLGDAVLEKWLEYFGLSSIPEFLGYLEEGNYNTHECVEMISGFGPHAAGLIDSLLATLLSTELNPEVFLVSLSLDQVGDKLSSRIAYQGITSVLEDVEQVTELPGATYRSVISLSENLEFIKRVYGFFKFKELKKKDTNVRFRVAVTGEISKGRKVFEEEWKAYGVIVGGVSRQTDFLICNAPTDPKNHRTKYHRAREFGVRIISENEFNNILSEIVV